jgi:hypothetical protein
MAAYPRARVAQGTLTTAQVNANSLKGTHIVPPSTGRRITVVDCWIRSINHTVGGCTAVVIQDTAASPDIAVTNTAANMTSGLILRLGATGSAATKVGTALGVGQGLQIGCTVTDMTSDDGLDYYVEYVVT